MGQSYPLQTDKTQSLKNKQCEFYLRNSPCLPTQVITGSLHVRKFGAHPTPKEKASLVVSMGLKDASCNVSRKNLDNLLPRGQNWLDQKLIRKHGVGGGGSYRSSSQLRVSQTPKEQKLL